MALGKFEQLCKMTRLGPEPLSTISGPPPVKFRPVYFDSSLEDEDDNRFPTSSSDEFDLDEDILHADLSFNGDHFYKDPMRPAYDKTEESSTNEEDSSSSSKLGRNMRACGSKSVKTTDKTVWGQMAARKQLLEDQKKQHLIHSKRETTEKEATALVNNLLQQGFHITPPDTTPRTTKEQPAFVSDDDNDDVSASTVHSSIRGEGDLVKSIHHELKRVQAVNGGTGLTT